MRLWMYLAEVPKIVILHALEEFCSTRESQSIPQFIHKFPKSKRSRFEGWAIIQYHSWADLLIIHISVSPKILTPGSLPDNPLLHYHVRPRKQSQKINTPNEPVPHHPPRRCVVKEDVVTGHWAMDYMLLVMLKEYSPGRVNNAFWFAYRSR